MMKEWKYMGQHWSGKVHEVQGLKFVHCTVRKYNKAVHSEIVDAMADIVWKHHRVFGIAMDEKQEHFMRSVGGRPSAILHEGHDGIVRRLYLWE